MMRPTTRPKPRGGRPRRAFAVALLCTIALHTLLAGGAQAQRTIDLSAYKSTTASPKLESMFAGRTASPTSSKNETPPATEEPTTAPEEWSHDCPVPTLAECMQPGYLEGKVAGAQRCGALQGSMHLTCSRLLQEEVASYPTRANVFADNVVSSGVVASSHGLPEDPRDPDTTYYTGELSAPESELYRYSFVRDAPFATTFSQVDPRDSWRSDGDVFDVCEEYAYQEYMELTNFWHEMGPRRHDHLEVFRTAFDPSEWETAVGHRHLDESDFVDIYEHATLPSWRNAPRNRFLVLPGGFEATGLAFDQVPAPGSHGADLLEALRRYTPLGAEIADRVENATEVNVRKNMAWYKDYFDNMAVEAVPEFEPQLSATTGETKPSPAGMLQLYQGVDMNPGFDLSSNEAAQDPSDITGRVPAPFNRGKVMRRRFASEFDALYDLQQEKQRLVRDWRRLDRRFEGSGWTIHDLLAALEIDDFKTLPPAPVTPVTPIDYGVARDFEAIVPNEGISGSSTFRAIADGGITLDPKFEIYPPPPPPTPPRSSLGEENEARKAVLDGLLRVYAQAIEEGCLDGAPTACDASPKEFSREALTHAAEEQQDAYETCVRLLPGRVADHLGTRRKLIDPKQDTNDEQIPRSFKRGNPDWQHLKTFACTVNVPSPIRNANLHMIEHATEFCQLRMSDYQAALSDFVESYKDYKAKYEARARLAQYPDLVDPDTGEIRVPGRSSSWHEDKGNSYFGLEMGYSYAFETDLGSSICRFDLDAGGDFYAKFKILGQEHALADVAAWIKTEREEIEVKAILRGDPLFDGLHVTDFEGVEEIPLDFVEIDEGFDLEIGGVGTTIFVGPVPVSLGVGAGGRVGFRFNFDGVFVPPLPGADSADECIRLSLDGSIEPYVGVYGFIAVSIDAVIVEVGVEGSLTLLEVSTPVTVGVELAAMDTPQDDYFPVDLSLDIEMDVAAEFTTLDGRFDLFLELGVCPFFCKRFDKTLVRWDGFGWDKTLFTQTYNIDISDLMLAMSED